jgi:hypothetical protein
MPTKLGARQIVSRDVLDQIAATGAELDNILRSINSNETAPLSLSAVGTNRIVNIGSIFVTNPETSKNKTTPTINNALPNFTSGTVTAPATGAGSITVSAGSPLTIAMTANQFLKIGINIDNLGNISLTAGTAGASLAAATAPAPVSNTFSPGYIVLRTDSSNNMANILNSDIYQYVGGGGGGGSGSSSSTEIVQANTFSVGNLVYLNGSTYTLARADSANTASVVGMVSVASSTRFTIVTSGLVTGLTGLTVGADYFLDGVTAGLATTADPTTIGYVSAPIGIAASATSMYIAIKRGVVVGTSNVFNNITLANNAATTIQNISSFANGEGGILTGTIKIDATTDYTFGFEISFTKDLAGVINHSVRYFAGDVLPTIVVSVSGQNIQVTLGTLAGFVSASARFQLSASAVSPVLTTASGSGVNELPQKNYLKDYYDASGTFPSVSTLASTTSNLVSLTAFYADSTSGASALTINASTLLRGTTNYLTATGTSNATGARFVQFPAFALEGTDLGKPVSVLFDVTGVTTDGNWDAVIVRYNSAGVHQSIISIAGNASSGTTPVSAKLPTGTTTFNGFFVPDSTTAGDLYALRLRSLANTVQIRVDTLFVGNQPIRGGAAVTDPVEYTPQIDGFGTISYSDKIYWKRNGSSIEIWGRATTGTPTAAEARIYLPTGLTVGPAAANNQYAGRWVRNSSTATQIKGGPLLSNSANTNFVTFAYDDTAGASTPFTAQLGNNIIAAAQVFSFAFVVPVSQWTTNVTMADRAVEEYASTSGTWDADSTTTVLGPQGTQIGGALTSARVKTITWNTAVQATDKFFVELSEDQIQWHDAGGFSNTAGSIVVLTSLDSTGTASTGSGYFIAKAASTNQTRVIFCRYASIANDDLPVVNWATGIYWRVRKVSGGAQVGYPISSANIVGRVDGNAPATGMVGERISATGGGIVTGSMPAANVAANVATLSLPSAGTYQVFGTAQFKAGASTAMGGDPYHAASIGTTSATINAANIVYGNTNVATAGVTRGVYLSDTFTVSAATTLYLVIQHGASTIGGASYGAIGTDGGTRFYAVRIA